MAWFPVSPMYSTPAPPQTTAVGVLKAGVVSKHIVASVNPGVWVKKDPQMAANASPPRFPTTKAWPTRANSKPLPSWAEAMAVMPLDKYEKAGRVRTVSPPREGQGGGGAAPGRRLGGRVPVALPVAVLLPVALPVAEPVGGWVGGAVGEDVRVRPQWLELGLGLPLPPPLPVAEALVEGDRLLPIPPVVGEGVAVPAAVEVGLQ